MHTSSRAPVDAESLHWQTFWCFFSCSYLSLRSRCSLSSSRRSSSASCPAAPRPTSASRNSRTRTTRGTTPTRHSHPNLSMTRSNSWPSAAAMSYTSMTVSSAAGLSSADITWVSVCRWFFNYTLGIPHISANFKAFNRLTVSLRKHAEACLNAEGTCWSLLTV